LKTKKILALLLSLIMILGMMPVSVLAETVASSNETAVMVNFTSQTGGAFLHAPQLGVSVSRSLAEDYGYTDSVDGVSALDVLVKAHEVIFGEDFSSETKDAFLVVPETGFITTIFGEETSASSFILNGMYPHDGTQSYGYYNGTTVTTQEVADNDTVEFFIYQDQTDYLDELAWFCYNGSPVSGITDAPGQETELTLKSIAYMWYGGMYENIDVLHTAGTATEDAQLAWVDVSDGTLSDIDSAVTDENGSVMLTMPEDEGTYYLTAYITAEDIEEDFSPVVMSLTKVVVSNDAPQYGACDLTALGVCDFASNPGALELTPDFDSSVTEYVTPVVDYPSTDIAVFRSAYVKAAAASDTAVISAECNGVTCANVTADSWNILNGALLDGKNNVLKITVKASDVENAETKEYKVTIPMKPQTNTAPHLKDGASAVAESAAGKEFKLNLSEIFTDPDEIDTLTYTVKINDGTAKTADKNYSFTPDGEGEYILTFVANDGSENSAEYVLTLKAYATAVATITVPSDATLFVGSKPTRISEGGTVASPVHFVPFDEVEPYGSESADGGTTYYYELKKDGTYNLRVSGENYVTYADKFQNTGETDISVTLADLQPEGKGKKTVDRDLTSNNGYNVADIYLNINPGGHLKMAESGDTFRLIGMRNWQTVDTVTNNYFIEPDYHYTVVDESGRASADVVTVDENGLITAKGEGTAIVLVTYDAINVKSAAGGPFFGAIWPENTGVFVVSVAAEDSGIETGITANSGLNDAGGLKKAGNALDAEHDVVYFAGESGSYTFTAETDGCSVFVANPTVTQSDMSFDGFEKVAENNDGSFTVPLVEGRNIVKFEKDGKAEYQVITAKSVNVLVNGGEAVQPGDELLVEFDTLYHPINKLSGVYNMNAQAVYNTVSGYDGKPAGGTRKQYNFASNADAQTINSIVKYTASAWSVGYSTAESLTVPEDYAADTFTLSDGVIFASGYGYDVSHRDITLTDGSGSPTGLADLLYGYFGTLPDIEIPVAPPGSELQSISVSGDFKTEGYYEGDVFDAEGLIVTANYEDERTQLATNYEISPAVLTADTEKVTITYRGKTVDINIGEVTPLKVSSIAVTTPPTCTNYSGGDVFDPTGLVVTATYNSGKTAVVYEYTYEPKRELKEGDTEITITYTGEDTAEGMAAVTTPITVSAASPGGSGSGDTPDTVTVRFTLLGDTKHGEPENAVDTHTYKAGNLTEWIEATNITVPQNSKVIDVLKKALGTAGMKYENPTGNYVESIKGLGEQDNGALSGWMYTLNGEYSNYGVSEQTVKDGDIIVFHYTDDYTQERTSLGGTSAGSASNTDDKNDEDDSTQGQEASVTITPEATVDKDGVAKVEISKETVSSAIKHAEKEENVGFVVIAPEVNGNAAKVSVELPKTAVQVLSDKSDLSLTVATPIADVTIQSGGLSDLSGKANISAETKDGAVKIEVAVDGKPLESVPGGVGVTVPAEGLSSDSKVLVLVGEDGTETVIKKSVADEDGVSAFLKGSATVKIADNSKSFSDIDGHWGESAINFAASREIFNGTGSGFAPDESMNRAMLVTTLYRLEDATADTKHSFSDVPDGTWYTDAVSWANSNGIVNGTGRGFEPEGNITREQLATMLYRYAEYIGMDRGARSELNRFGDSVNVSEWAKDSMEWAVGLGIITGKPGELLDPSGNATRAEVAAIYQRLIRLMIK